MTQMENHIYLWCFNPRTRRGCDKGINGFITLHKGFNPRTRRGCDLANFLAFCSTCMFQSTHPQGVRRPHSKSIRH